MMKRSMQFFNAALMALSISLTSGALAQDAAKLDPKHYKVEFENDQVRVLRITYGPGEKSVMHAHPASVAVFLTDVEAKFTYPDGKSGPITAKAGQAIWLSEVKHQSENTAGAFELIQVEMKTKAEGMKDAARHKASEAQDAAKLDPKHYKVEFENDRVKVLRINYGPHEKSVMHEHPASIAVFLTLAGQAGGKGQFAYPDGKTEEISWNALAGQAGQTIWLPATKHQPANLTDQPFELVQIEMKK